MTINFTGVRQGDVVKETINYFEKLNSCHMWHIVYCTLYVFLYTLSNSDGLSRIKDIPVYIYYGFSLLHKFSLVL
jgi:uncharacterized membrane protein